MTLVEDTAAGLDLALLSGWTDPERFATYLDGRPETIAQLLKDLDLQVAHLQSMSAMPARYHATDLLLDADIVNLEARLAAAVELGDARLAELNDITARVIRFGMIIQGYWETGGAISAARADFALASKTTENRIVDEEGDNPFGVIEKSLSEEVLPRLSIRLTEATRLHKELMRRAAGISIFNDETAFALRAYRTLIERQRQVIEAQHLANPNPVFQEQMATIRAATETISSLSERVQVENEQTRQRVKALLDDLQRRRDALNPVKILENIYQTVDKAIQDTGRAINQGAIDIGRTLEKAANDAGKSIEKGWNDFSRETWIGLTNVFREFTIGMCRLFHGSPDREDKDHDGDGVNDGFAKCMGEGWQAGVQLDGDGNVTGVGVDPPGIPGGTLWIPLVTDEDIEKERQRVKDRGAYLRSFNDTVRANFQPDPMLPQELAIYESFRADPDWFLRPFGELGISILGAPAEGMTEAYTDKNGKVWTSKKDYSIALAVQSINNIDKMLLELDGLVLGPVRLQIGVFFLATRAVYETTAALVAMVPGPHKGLLMAFGAASDIATGDDISLRLLIRVAGIPYIDVYESWLAIITYSDQFADTNAEIRKTRKALKDQKNLYQDKIIDLKKL